MTTWRSLSLLAALALTISGCAGLKDMAKAQKPEASVTGVSVAALSLTGITLDTHIKLKNPNPFALKTAGLDLDLATNGKHLLSASQPDSKLTLPANGSTETTVPVTIKFSDLYAAVSGLKGKNEVPYALDGKVRFNLPVLGDVSIPLSYEDVLPIPQLPQIKLQDISLVKAGFSSIQLKLDMLVSNPNSFGLDLNKLNLGLSAQGKSISSASLSSVSLDKGGSQSVSVPVSLSLSQLGASLFSMLTSKNPVNFAVDGKADVLPAISSWKPEAMSFHSEKALSL